MPDVTPGGFELEADEVVLRTGKDWGVSISPLVLTSRRLISPIDPSGGPSVAIPLTEIHDVRLRKPFIGFVTVIVEWGDQQRASFPAHINAARIRADIQAAAEAARPPKLSIVPSEPGAGDRYDRLRRLGELRSLGRSVGQRVRGGKSTDPQGTVTALPTATVPLRQLGRT